MRSDVGIEDHVWEGDFSKICRLFYLRLSKGLTTLNPIYLGPASFQPQIQLYRFYKKAFPDGLQSLCVTCQLAKKTPNAIYPPLWLSRA